MGTNAFEFAMQTANIVLCSIQIKDSVQSTYKIKQQLGTTSKKNFFEKQYLLLNSILYIECNTGLHNKKIIFSTFMLREDRNIFWQNELAIRS